MKKFLSIMLAVMMVLSTVSFAAPSIAGVADSAVEMPEVEVSAPAADLAADTEAYYDYNFDNGELHGFKDSGAFRGAAISSGTYDGQGVMVVDLGGCSWQPATNPNNGDYHSAGKFAVEMKPSDLKDVEIRYALVGNDAPTTQTVTLYGHYDGAVNASAMVQIKGLTPDAKGWYTISGVDLTAITGKSGTLTAIQTSVCGTNMKGKDCKLYFDYYRFMGLAQTEVTLNVGDNTDFDTSTTTIKVTEATTVEEALTLIKTPDGSDFVAKGLMSGSTRLALTDKVLGNENLTILWATPDDFGYDFDTAVENGDVANSTHKTFDLTKVEDGDNIIAEFTTTAKKDPNGVIPSTGIRSDRAQIFFEGLNAPAGELQKIQVKLRYTARPEHGTEFTWYDSASSKSDPSKTYTYNSNNTVIKLWWYDEEVDAGNPLGGKNLGNCYTMPALNEWVTFTIDVNDIVSDTSAGVNGGIKRNFRDCDITKLRFDMWNADMPEGITVQFDDVKLIGNIAYDVVVDISDTGLADQTIKYTNTTTVADILNKLDLSAYTGNLVAKTIAVNDEVLSTSAKIASYINDGDEVKVVWKKDPSILHSYEFTDGKEGVSYNRGVTTTAANGLLTLDFSTATEANAHSASSIAPMVNIDELSDIKIRMRFTDSNTEAPLTSYNMTVYANYGLGLSIGGKDNCATLRSDTFTNGQWLEFSLKTKFGTTFDTIMPKGNGYKLEVLRLDFPAALPKTVKVDIDYIRFVCEPTIVNIDMGDNAEVDDDTVGFTSVTTVAQLINKIDLSAYNGTKYITGLKTEDGALLRADAKVVDCGVKAGDTLTAVWGEQNILFAYEFDAVPTAPHSITGATGEIKAGKLHLSTTTGTSGAVYVNFAGLELDWADVKDIVVRLKFPTTVAKEYALVYNNNQTGIDPAMSFTGEFQTISLADIYTGTFPESGAITAIRMPQCRYKVGGGQIPNGTELVFDYIRVIGKDADPITVDMGGICDDLTAAYKSTTTVKEFIESLSYPTTTKFTGLSLTEGGEALAETAVLSEVLGEATTLYALWNNVAALGFSYEFDTNDGYSFKTFTGGEYIDSYSTPVYGFANKNGESYVTHNEAEGYITLNYAVSDELKAAAEAAGKLPVVYDSVIYFEGLDGIPCEGGSITEGAFDEILVKYRVNGVAASIGATGYQINAKGEYKDVSIDGKPYFMYWNDAVTPKQGAKLAAANGDWQYATLAPSYVGFVDNDTTEKLYVLRFDAPDAMPDGSSIDIDYVRFIGKPVTAPDTLEEETAVRPNNDDEDYTNAIRFKASIDSLTRENSETIGWLVSTASFLGENELDYDFFTATNSNKVKVAYQKLDNDPVVKYFFDDRDDNNQIFAAFIYNIPEEYALEQVVVRPFVVSGGAYYYGEATSTSLYDMVVAPNLTWLDDSVTPKDIFTPENGFTMADLSDFCEFNEAYTALEAPEQEYVVEIMETLLGVTAE